MEIDVHCMEVLGKLARGEISYFEAQFEIDSHREGLLDAIILNGFKESPPNIEVKGFSGFISKAGI